MSGIERHIALYNPVFRENIDSKLITDKPCFSHIVLTSSDESQGKINDAWGILLKRIKRKFPSFAYFKIETREGVKGVLHIISYCNEFITKHWLSSNWCDSFQASITWTTQCYGNKFSIANYLLKYLKHHDWFRYGMSQNWVYKGFCKDMHEILNFTTINTYGYIEQLRKWKVLLNTKLIPSLLKPFKKVTKKSPMVIYVNGLKLSCPFPLRCNCLPLRLSDIKSIKSQWASTLLSSGLSQGCAWIRSLRQRRVHIS